VTHSKLTKKQKVEKITKFLMYCFPQLTMIQAVDMAAQIIEQIED
jgi:hypothetical protein